jgi:putative sugar O-methyltransferase
LKAKHLRHPFRSITAAKVLAKTYFDVKLFPYRSRLRFRGDSRYQLQNVTEGFSSRIDDSSNDQQLLERICSAYIKAIEHQETAPETYQPSRWWRQVQQTRLRPVMQALNNRDIQALRTMYRNFYRDSCSSGLIIMTDVPWAVHHGEIKDIHRHFYLGDSLCCVDYWKQRTAGRFPLADLAGPNIGNPFGVMLDGTLVRFEAPYQHYCAHRLSTLLDPRQSTVVEIGGGFGGMAYFLLRDRQPVTYLDFDLPECIALASYFLLKAFPSLTFLLYGEKEMTSNEIEPANVVLMPLFEIEKLQPRSVDVTFSSHAISALPSEFIAHYLDTICRTTRGYFLYIGGILGEKAISELASKRMDLRMLETCVSGWNAHKTANWNDVEALYRVG